MAHDIFISYTQPDKKKAFAIHDMFEANQLQSWIAPSFEHGIPAGANFENEIVGAIAASKVFVLVYSNYCNISKNIIIELRHKIEQQLIIIRLDNSDYTNLLSYQIKGSQWIDALGIDENTVLNNLLREVRKALNIFKPVEAGSTDKFLLKSGLQLLQNKMYREAEKELKQYSSIDPANGFAKFALALSIIKARNTRKLDGFEVRRIEAILSPLLNSKDNACIRLLLAIIKNGYYSGNGFRQTIPSAEELLYGLPLIGEHDNAGIIFFHLHPEDLVWLKRNKLYNF